MDAQLPKVNNEISQIVFYERGKTALWVCCLEINPVVLKYALGLYLKHLASSVQLQRASEEQCLFFRDGNT